MSKKQENQATESSIETVNETAMNQVAESVVTEEVKHNEDPVVTKIMSDCDDTQKATIQAAMDNLSAKGMQKLSDRVNEVRSKMAGKNPAQKTAMMLNIIAPIAVTYNKSNEKHSAGTRGNNEHLNSIKKAMVQIDPATGEVIALHESIQAANRAMQDLHGNPKQRFDSSICYCAKGKKGFANAGGFKWATVTDLPEGTVVGDIIDLTALKQRLAEKNATEEAAKAASKAEAAEEVTTEVTAEAEA